MDTQFSRYLLYQCHTIAFMTTKSVPPSRLFPTTAIADVENAWHLAVQISRRGGGERAQTRTSVEIFQARDRAAAISGCTRQDGIAARRKVGCGATARHLVRPPFRAKFSGEMSIMSRAGRAPIFRRPSFTGGLDRVARNPEPSLPPGQKAFASSRGGIGKSTHADVEPLAFLATKEGGRLMAD